MSEISETTDLFSKFDGMIALRESVRGPGREDPFGLVMELQQAAIDNRSSL